MTLACRTTLSGAITVSLALVGPTSGEPTHVLLAVAYAPDDSAGSPHQRRDAARHLAALSDCCACEHGAAVVPADASIVEELGAAAAACRVGLGALPPALAKAVLTALESDSEGDAFSMHNTGDAASAAGGRGGAGGRPIAVTVSSHSVVLDTEPILGQSVSLPLSAHIASAIGGHIGMRQEGARRVKFWLLLPAVASKAVPAVVAPAAAPAAAAAGPSDVGVAPTGGEEALPPPSHPQPPAARARISNSQAYPATAAVAVAPAAAAPAAAAAANADAGVATAPPPGAPVVIESVIVVDDEGILRRLAERMFGRAGLRCVSLEDGSELADAIEPGTGLVLLDIVMKRSDGVRVRRARALRVGVRGWHATVAVCTDVDSELDCV